ncbi:MAG: SLATT domain-containing protein [Bacteroidota bacterium]|nr:SLATT domain-containing protein [Bacteroidota bacterium]
MNPKNLLIQIQELHCDSKIGKDRHFIAADKKGTYGKKIGLTVVIINVLIGSMLINLIKEEELKKIILSVFSLLAASLAAIQTFFNYAKDVENHRKIGNLYLEIARDADNLLSRFKDNYIDKENCQKDYDKLLMRYKLINKEEEVCPNSKRDYKRAYAKNKKNKERIRQLKEENNYQLD